MSHTLPYLADRRSVVPPSGRWKPEVLLAVPYPIRAAKAGSANPDCPALVPLLKEKSKTKNIWFFFISGYPSCPTPPYPVRTDAAHLDAVIWP